MKRLIILSNCAAAALLGIALSGSIARAQVPSPDRKHLFTEDTRQTRQTKKAAVKEALSTDKAPSDDLDLVAPQIEFSKDQNTAHGSGGVILSRSGVQAQADSAEVNIKNQDAKLDGNVFVSTEQGVIGAKTGNFNLDSETGQFNNAHITVEDGSYDANAEKLFKLSETEYKLFDSSLTTCHCADDYVPWKIYSDEAHITQEGYAHTFGSTVKLFGVPIFYSPYLGFPAKMERQTGLLMPSFGYSNKNGFLYRQSLFMALDDSTDLTLTPYIETKTRNSLGAMFRESFGDDNNAKATFIYSDERPRGTSLRGTSLEDTGESAPTEDGSVPLPWDEDRTGFSYSHLWKGDSQNAIPFTFISDVHYVSDMLFLREITAPDIGDKTDRFTTSTMALRTELGEYANAELSGEYNQALIEDETTSDELVFHRLPEATVSGNKSWRPFGFNSLGLKVVTKGAATITDFMRRGNVVGGDGLEHAPFDGVRTDLGPTVSVPFHVENYFNSAFYVGMHRTTYNLNDVYDPAHNLDLDSSNSRNVFNVGYSMSTAVERVYTLDEGNWLTYLTSLGAKNQSNRLLRLKHVVEPLFRYDFVPKTEQDDLPLFDSFDRIRNRSLFTYGFSTSLMGRFLPRYEAADAVQELTPRVGDVAPLDATRPLTDLGLNDEFGGVGAISVRKGQIRELVNLRMYQTYDYAIARDPDRNPGQRSLSDIGSKLGFYPTQDFGIQLESNFSNQDKDFSSWGIATRFDSDRGDALKLRASYVEPDENDSNSEGVKQLEGNLEVVVLDQLKAGYYTRYDDVEREFIENRVGLRFSSACNCWHLDLDYHDRINPETQDVILSFTFGGIGALSQSTSMLNDSDNGS